MKFAKRFTIRTVTVRAAIVSGAFVLVGALITVGPPLLRGGLIACDLRVEDVAVVEEEGVPALDIRLRNAGEQVCFVTSAEVRVTRVLALELPAVTPRLVPVSADYQVDLPPEAGAYEYSISVAQAVDGNDVDRFRLSFGCSRCAERPHVYAMSIRLWHSEESIGVDTDQVLVYVSPPTRLMGFYQSQPQRISGDGLSFRRLADANPEVMAELRGMEGIQSPHLSHLLERSSKPINLSDPQLKSFNECEDNIALAFLYENVELGGMSLEFRAPSIGAAALEYLERAIPNCRGTESVPHPVLWTQVNATPPGVARAPRGPRSACGTRASRAARSCCTAPRTRSLRRVPP